MADKTQKNNNYFAELDRANILHLRELLAERISAALNPEHNPAHALRMPMICAYSFNI